MGNDISVNTDNKTGKPDDPDQDTFIVKYNRNTLNIINQLSMYDERRTIFVSLNGLYSSYNKCPSIVLHSAILLMPLQKQWIYNSPTTKSSAIWQCMANGDNERKEDFIQFLQWKDSQNLVFWMKDNYKCNGNGNKLIDSFWIYFNEQLQSLYDPVTNGKYKKLQFDAKWW
eukprot:38545_1